MNKNVFTNIACLILSLLIWSPACEGQEDTSSGSAVVAAPPDMVPMQGTPALAPIDESAPFTFIVFGDSQSKDPNHPVLRNIVEEINSTKPAVGFVISLGDIIQGEPHKPTSGEITKDTPTGWSRTMGPAQISLGNALTKAKTMMAIAGVPVFNAPGNHELDDSGNHIPGGEVPSPGMLHVYKSMIGQTYGSFDYGNSHFIILNTEDLPTEAAMEAFIAAQAKFKKQVEKENPNAEYHPQEFSFLGHDQRAWLKADLDAHKNAKHIFIAMHYPIYPFPGAYGHASQLDDDSRDFLLDLLKPAAYPNISYVFASHQHLFYNHHDPGNVKTVETITTKSKDLPRYLVTGGAGAEMHPDEGTSPECFYHYLKFAVDGDTVNATIHRVK